MLQATMLKVFAARCVDAWVGDQPNAFAHLLEFRISCCLVDVVVDRLALGRDRLELLLGDHWR